MKRAPSPEQDPSINQAAVEASPAVDAAREFDYFAEARAHGRYLGLPQQEDETDSRYRDRIAGVLRGQGRIIEAHEAASGRRFDNPGPDGQGPMVGIMGVLAQALGGHEYSPNNPESQVGDDIAAGIVVTTRQDQGDAALAHMFGLLGPATTMDILGAFQRPKEQ